ncbi:hypothetical protein RB653_001392 [Dictyostelium firmibasis]|uniref:SCD domain-containing protein n=1 Tax=Dictyostelium firmibasis TaxID=79012 RepID=A0AAN7Z220_9MYCE
MAKSSRSRNPEDTEENVTTPVINKKPISKGKKKQSDLFESIKKKCNLQRVLDDWIDRYTDQDPEKSVLELLTLLFDCGGAETTITFKDFKDLEIEDAATSIVEQSDSQQYPLGSKRSKLLIENFNEFWREIVEKCKKSIIFDNYLLDMVTLWLHELSFAAKRGIRHAATQAAIQITSSLISICNDLRKDLNATTRQLAGENKNSSRQKQLKDNQLQTSSRLKSMESILIVRLFTGVFSPRFKDSLPEMRALCIIPYCNWILEYPIQLLNHQNLKYIGWLLGDHSNEPRQAAISGLCILYSNENYINQLDPFTQCFKHRIVEIAFSDKTPSISVEAIRLVSIMSNLDLLDESDVQKICTLYLVDQPEISKAAGGLIFSKYLSSTQTKIDTTLTNIINSTSAATTTSNGRKKSKTTITTSDLDEQQQQQISSQIYHHRETQLNALLEFLDKTVIPEEPYYLVQSLWTTDGKSLFVDWPFWVDYLESIESKNINDKQMGMICKFLSASVRIAVNDRVKIFTPPQLHHLAQYRAEHTPTTPMTINTDGEMEVATTQLPPTASKRRGRKPAAATITQQKSKSNEHDDEGGDEETNEQADDDEKSDEINESVCREITRQFIIILPELLVLYRANTIVCQSLIEIARYFVLDCYVTLRLQSKYTALLEAISDIFTSQPKTQLIDTISVTLENLLNNGKTPSQLETASKAALHSLFTELIDTLRLTKITQQQPSQQSQESIANSQQQSSSSSQSDTNNNNDNNNNNEESQVFPVISTLYKLDSLCKQFNFADEKFASMIFKFTDGSVNGVPIQTIDDSDSIIIHSTSIYSQLLMWSLFSAIPSKFYQVDPMNVNILQMFYLLSSRTISTLKNEDITHRLRNFMFTTFIETRSLFSPVLDLTNMTVYDISLPAENLLFRTISSIFSQENEYSLTYLKVEFIKNQQISLEKKKLAEINKSKRKGGSKKPTGAGATSEEEITSHSEKETSDHETESDGGAKNQQKIKDTDLQLLNSFVPDQQFGERAVELVTSICNCIKYSFVTQSTQLFRLLLKQIALSSSKRAVDIIRDFFRKYPVQSGKFEMEIVIDLMSSFQSTCLEEVIASNPDFQHHMFSRFRSLCQWLVSDFIRHPDTIRGVIEHFLNYALKNPQAEKLEELLEILDFLGSKLSEKSSIEFIKKRVIFNEDFPHIDLINKLNNTIEFQTIQNLEPSGKTTGKKIKQQLKFASATTATKKTAPKKRRRSSKVSESEESEPDSEESDYEEDRREELQRQKNIIKDQIQRQQDEDEEIDEQKASSEDSSDFEPPIDPKKKLKTIN